MNLHKQKAILLKAGYWLLTAGAIYLGIRYLTVWLLPLLLGFLIAWLLRPVAKFLQKHSGLNGRGASIVSAIIFYLALGGLLWLIGWGVGAAANKAKQVVPQFFALHIVPALSQVGTKFGIWERRLGTNVGAQQITEALEAMAGNLVAALSEWGMQALGGIVQGIPSFIVAVLFTVISSVLICSDYDRVTTFVMNQIPVRMHTSLLEVRAFMTMTLWKLLKAYLILMIITFAVLATGLGLIGIQGFWVISGVVAVLDLLPVIGSGAVLLPWAIGLLLMQDTFTGVGILVVWCVLSVLRQILEPRIVGNQIGLHPLATLTAMYIGLKVAGFTGLLLAPVACLLLQHLQEEGIVTIFHSE